jgi:hypothetical protein
VTASKINFFGMEPKPLGFHRTDGTNDKVKQRDALIFARHPIRVTDNQLSTMLTSAIHHIPPYSSV